MYLLLISSHITFLSLSKKRTLIFKKNNLDHLNQYILNLSLFFERVPCSFMLSFSNYSSLLPLNCWAYYLLPVLQLTHYNSREYKIFNVKTMRPAHIIKLLRKGVVMCMCLFFMCLDVPAVSNTTSPSWWARGKLDHNAYLHASGSPCIPLHLSTVIQY